MNKILPLIQIALVTCSLTTLADPLPAFRFGGDERDRWEFLNNIPSKVDSPAYSRNGENDYFRFRTRLWAEYDLLPDVTARARIVNESRDWLYPDVSQKPQKSTSEWPDEWVFDNLYLEIRNLLDKTVDLRIGRQDLLYGNGRVICDGTPGDGSRTLDFNAIKATIKASPHTQLDLFGTYNEPEDQWAINGAQRDLSAFSKAPEGVTELGGGAYLKNGTLTNLPFESYLLYKREAAWDQTVKRGSNGKYPAPSFGWQQLDTSKGILHNPDFDIETAGVRLMPVFTPSLSGNLEVAGQYGTHGDNDMHAFMVDSYLVQKLPLPLSPAIKGGVYLLSGDNPKTATDEGWNPLWSRCPQSSELYAFAYDAEQSTYRWSNLIDPNLGVSITPTKQTKTTATVHYLGAFEADGNGGGNNRGWLYQLRQEFTLKENLLRKQDKLTTYVLVEYLDPGDYYKNQKNALFARWEVMYAF